MLSKKRLHDELTPEKRELLRFGAELAEREFKRLKKRDANECVDGEEDWSFVMDLSMD
jgi:nitrate/TMAO reductase-like tetraheme cytochrome c subunit